MNGILKQRLVGALVLIALGVIFWPVLFVDPGQNGLDRSTQVPPMPDFPDREISRPHPLQGLEGPQPIEELELHDEPPQAIDLPLEPDVEHNIAAVPVPPATDPGEGPGQAPAENPALDERGIPIAWVVQVATMSQRDKAEALQNELIGLGYKSSVKAINRDNRSLYKVYIGPKFDKSQVQQIKNKVDSRFGVNSIIARYLP